ncbi:NUDIX hydrolase [Pseudidiomarina halophila]|uniref:GDP-mannose pyrophosphatase n=1 Tax=Pseudidiomarina halophila TaxID=1449799 RepID=A0A432XYV7_9GAMM|nr:NUDIX hydrolase [Pseudidiomarina halophila]RUO53877.1 hypothetical protein CWI69_00080 [Pseudidiomarina halophila]
MVNVYKGDHRLGEIEIIEQVTVFENSYATLYNDKVRFPGGETGNYLRFWWNAPYGVIIFATTPTGQLLLIRNFRHEDRNWQWEVPKGFGEPGVSPQACAAKELSEETGYQGEDWQSIHVLQSHGTPTHLFKATIKAQNPSAPEVSEAIAQEKLLSLAECKELIAAGEVHDPTTLYAISLLELQALS